jgi:hypothetical protein
MSRYTETLTITLPYSPEMADIASRIAKAMDPDVGGEYSFIQDGDQLICRTPCVPEFKAQAMAMLDNAALLHHVVQMDYSTRWPDLDAPSLEDCEAFVAALGVA